MNRSRQYGFTVLGFIGVVLLACTAGAQPTSSADDTGKYTGTSGSQALQEEMYENRFKEMFGGQPEGGRQVQGTEGRKGMGGAEESSQKMQSDHGQAPTQGRQGMKGSGASKERDR